jgi:hypothetical protein
VTPARINIVLCGKKKIASDSTYYSWLVLDNTTEQSKLLMYSNSIYRHGVES